MSLGVMFLLPSGVGKGQLRRWARMMRGEEELMGMGGAGIRLAVWLGRLINLQSEKQKIGGCDF